MQVQRVADFIEVLGPIGLLELRHKPAAFARGELRDGQPIVRARLAGEAPQFLGIDRLNLRLVDGQPVAFAFQVQCHPAVHRFAHRLVVIVLRLHRQMLH